MEFYLSEVLVRGTETTESLTKFSEGLEKLTGLLAPFATQKRDPDPLAESWNELSSTQTTLAADIATFGEECERQAASWAAQANANRENGTLHAARKGLHPLAERCRDLTKQIDLVTKLCVRVVDVAVKELNARESEQWPNSEVNKARKALQEVQGDAVDALRLTRYFVKQADWLQERFPEGKLQDVAGLVKLVSRGDIGADGDWSLTPGRYVGVAPEEVDEGFDFEEALRSIHVDLKGLNEEAAELALRISKNFVGMGIGE